MSPSSLIKYVYLIVALLILVACGQSPETETEAEAPVADTPSAEPYVQERGVQSIDADGNVAPFGMASRKPVEVQEPAAAPAATEVAATSALYGMHCSACHGQDAGGVEGLGLNLVESDLVGSSSQEQLAAFLKEGRAADSPDSVTKVPMPSFAWMSDADLAEITAHLKSL